MSQKLWEADHQTKIKSNLYEFENFLSKKFNYKPEKNFKKLFNWTIKNPKLFWSSIWEFSNIKGIKNNKFYFPKEIIKYHLFRVMILIKFHMWMDQDLHIIQAQMY